MKNSLSVDTKSRVKNTRCFTIGVEHSCCTLFDRPEIANVLAGVCFERNHRYDPEAKTLLLLDSQIYTCATLPLFGRFGVGDHNDLCKNI